ncbi:MAG TPA: OmpA family protein [Gemmatimonadales bacterium]|jgi:outer membrane protein OmpA-like peptidoglycan-associated protein|nr:OmpA family protein [Gemmatimonadales bacterium]
MRTRMTLVVLATAAVPTLAAQRAHQFEIGPFASFTRYDRAFNLDNQIGFGGRLGYFFGRTVGIEVDLGHQSPSAKIGPDSATLTHFSSSLVLNFGGERNLFYLLGGYSRLDFEESAPYRFTDNAMHGAIGDRIFLGDRLALRLEARAIYAPSTGFTGGEWAGHIVGSLGFSIFAGAGAIVDVDRDGVADRMDACPGTPTGAIVDPKGCPSDADRDKVFNGLDACPNTVEGAQVDAQGCPTDADGDGVYDGLDQCAGTLTGARVDAKGCPADSDSDAVPDGLDQCPNTPAGATVDAAGCPTDSDKDGVADGLDKCPGTPAGTEVDSSGCQRAKDSDGDGVDDSKDKCPGTAAGTRVDAAGCPILFTSERTPVVLRGVTFESGKSALKPDSYTILDIVAASLVANPDIRVEIAGHTDNTGSAAVNTRLSQARADAVRAYLASKGVGPERMVAKGYGPTVPVATNTTPAGRAQNRRVELRQLF